MAMPEQDPMSVADTMDAIFGPGTAEQEWSGEDLETARRPYSYTPPGPGYHVRLKVTPSGHMSPTHPQAPLGRRGEVRTVQINSIPPSVPVAEVVRLYAGTTDLSDSLMWEFERLGIGRILR